MRLDAVLHANGGRLLPDGLPTEKELRVAYVGGSVTEQKQGYRPRLNDWLRASICAPTGAKLVEIPAWCGNSGSKVLSFVVSDWVVAKRPNLVFVELAINDGDTLLETEDATGVARAFEGILRQIRAECTTCAVCVLLMYVRGDMPLEQRTGSMAWRENTAVNAAEAYHTAVPAIHQRVAAHYGAPCINLIPLMAALSPDARDLALRDDCHLHPAGAALVASAICRSLARLAAAPACEQSPPPEPLDLAFWRRGESRDVEPTQLSFFYLSGSPTEAEQRAARDRILQRHTQLDADPLQPTRQRPWWLLYVGDSATVQFEGSRLAILTLVGPDSGTVRCEVDGNSVVRVVPLLDKWAYYWRHAVVSLVEGLGSGRHVARLSLERPTAEQQRVLKRPPSGPAWEACVASSKHPKLWLSYWLVGV